MPNYSFLANTPLQGVGRSIGSLLGVDFSYNPDADNPLPFRKINSTGTLTKNTTSTKKVGNSGSPNNKLSTTSTSKSKGGVNYYTGGQTGASTPAYDPAVVSQYDQSIGLVNDALSRLGTQLGIAQGNINRNYKTQVNELNSAKALNEKNYGTSSTQNQQNLRTNRNAILDQQSAGLRGLLRQLGAYGAVGSDLNLASGAVQDVANQQLNGAGQTYAQNQQNLDTNWNNYLSEWANSKKKLDDWRTSQLNDAEGQSLSQKQDLLTQLAGLRGARAAAMGGDYAGGAAADLASARGLSGRIDRLGRINPTYTGNTPVYNAPELSSYVSPEAAQTSIAPDSSTAANPLLSLLYPEDRRNQVL